MESLRLRLAKARYLYILRSVRKKIAFRYLRGNGIEIGALHNPLQVSKSAHVRYVDRMTVDDLRLHYPELRREKLVHVDLIDDGELLKTVPDNSQDFVIANHFVEHCENPLLALKNMLRVLKPLGIAYLAVPDKRFTFDADRPATTIEHLVLDLTTGAEQSRLGHFQEWVRYVSKIHDAVRFDDEVQRLMEMQYSIHFHSWNQREMVELLLYVQQQNPFNLEMLVFNKEENIFIICKN